MITILFGPPGSGKGTQAALVAKRLDVPHVSTGEILRAERDRGSALGREVAPVLSQGGLVPDELVVRVIEARLAEPDAVRGAILDGFPRTLPQALALEAMLLRRGWGIAVVVALDVADPVLEERVMQRAAQEGRDDDSRQAFARRMTVYRTDTEPVAEYYASHGVRIVHIDGVGAIDDIAGRIAAVMAAGINGVAS